MVCVRIQGAVLLQQQQQWTEQRAVLLRSTSSISKAHLKHSNMSSYETAALVVSDDLPSPTPGSRHVQATAAARDAACLQSIAPGRTSARTSAVPRGVRRPARSCTPTSASSTRPTPRSSRPTGCARAHVRVPAPQRLLLRARAPHQGWTRTRPARPGSASSVWTCFSKKPTPKSGRASARRTRRLKTRSVTTMPSPSALTAQRRAGEQVHRCVEAHAGAEAELRAAA